MRLATTIRWTAVDTAALEAAFQALARPSFAARLADKFGRPLEWGVSHLPERWRDELSRLTRLALHQALGLALRTMSDGRPSRRPALARRLHGVAAAITGAAGGAAGLPGLAVELPFTTTLILRAIADIARAEGEDVRSLGTQLACLEVFALGGGSSADDAAETGYFTARAALAKFVASASKRGVAHAGGPALAALMARIAERFSVQVTQKAMAALVPVIGAVGGMLVNIAFIDHFQSVARGHFAIRRLEDKYGAASVRSKYEALAARARR